MMRWRTTSATCSLSDRWVAPSKGNGPMAEAAPRVDILGSVLAG